MSREEGVGGAADKKRRIVEEALGATTVVGLREDCAAVATPEFPGGRWKRVEEDSLRVVLGAKEARLEAPSVVEASIEVAIRGSVSTTTSRGHDRKKAARKAKYLASLPDK